MSDTKTFTGVLKKVPYKFFDFKAVDEYLKINLKPEDYFSYVVTVKDELTVDELSGYILVGLNLFQVIDFNKIDEGDNFCELQKIGGNMIHFTTQFYSGGTTLEEMLLDEIGKQKMFRDPRRKLDVEE